MRDLVLICSEGSAIDIEDAFYGRSQPTVDVCPTSGPTNDDTSCDLDSALTTVRSACQDMTSCTIEPTNEFFGANPCSGTYKYVEVYYYCKREFFFAGFSAVLWYCTAELLSRYGRPSSVHPETRFLRSCN